MTHRALTGPRLHAIDSEAGKKREVLYVLQYVHEIREKLNRNEYNTVKVARDLGLSWTEIATSLGVTRQAAWERWHEIDGEAPHASPSVYEPNPDTLRPGPLPQRPSDP